MTHEIMSNISVSLTAPLHCMENVSVQINPVPFPLQKVLRHQQAFPLITTHFLLLKLKVVCRCTLIYLCNTWLEKKGVKKNNHCTIKGDSMGTQRHISPGTLPLRHKYRRVSQRWLRSDHNRSFSFRSS